MSKVCSSGARNEGRGRREEKQQPYAAACVLGGFALRGNIRIKMVAVPPEARACG